MAGALQDWALRSLSCIATHLRCLLGVRADCEGMGCVHEGIAKENPVYQEHATCTPLLPQGASTAVCECTYMESEAAVS